MAKENQKEAEKVKHENIYAALSAFQGELTPIEKSATVKFKTKSGAEVDFNYTPLGKIMEVIYPILAKHGLSVRHLLVKDNKGMDAVEAIITHESYAVESVKTEEIKQTPEEIMKTIWAEQARNQISSGPVKIYQGDGDMKDTGAAITYARRYSLTMALGIVSEDDTDAKLFMDRAEAAIDFAFKKATDGIKNAKKLEDLDKAVKVIRKDVELLNNGKAGALGLSLEQYEAILKMAEEKKVELGKTGTSDEGAAK